MLIFIPFSTSFASCIAISDKSLEFLPEGGDCVNKSNNGALKLYNGSSNNLNSLIYGKNNSGYMMHFAIDRDSSTITSKQSLITFYSDIEATNIVAQAGIDSNGQFFYGHGAFINSTTGITTNLSQDNNISKPHIIIINYDDRREKLTVNIDGDELYATNIDPITTNEIATAKVGDNYVGKISYLNIYATKLSIEQRNILSKILSKSNKATVRDLERSGNGILVSPTNSNLERECFAGEIESGDDCNPRTYNSPADYTLITDAEDPGEITYNNATQISPVAFNCSSGYISSTNPIASYYFDNSGNIQTQGSCNPTNIFEFVLNITTSNPSYSLTDEMDLGLSGSSYNAVDIDCDGDSILEYSAISDLSNVTCDYSATGSKTVQIAATTFKGFKFTNNRDLTQINIWGSAQFYDDASLTFYGAQNLTSIPTSTIDTSNITNMFAMFRNTQFNSDISGWDVSNVTDMQEIFNRSNFNQDISSWNVSNVTECSYLVDETPMNPIDSSSLSTLLTNIPSFSNCTPYIHYECYNGSNINSVGDPSWPGCANMYITSESNLESGRGNGYKINSGGTDYTYANSANNVFTGQVTNMKRLFNGSYQFNGDIGYWDVSNVTDMKETFRDNDNFNQDIGRWNFSAVTHAYKFLRNSAGFSRSIDLSKWGTLSFLYQNSCQGFLGGDGGNPILGNLPKFRDNNTPTDYVFYCGTVNSSSGGNSALIP
ncbi:BspA family leucine-rich repeat surface protein [Rickettsiales bacterium]|nr:BspA family leucine-rich repeat surface protein [Rickettsiales bacterium]